MAKQEKGSKENVVEIVTTHCAAETCKHKPVKAGFCNEHYEWFKSGLITKNGKQAKDFEKKHQQFQRRKKVA